MKIILGRVPSLSDATRTYALSIKGELHCTCPDAQYRDRECKHMLAFMQDYPSYQRAQIEELHDLIIHAQARIERIEQAGAQAKAQNDAPRRRTESSARERPSGYAARGK